MEIFFYSPFAPLWLPFMSIFFIGAGFIQTGVALWSTLDDWMTECGWSKKLGGLEESGLSWLPSNATFRFITTYFYPSSNTIALIIPAKISLTLKKYSNLEKMRFTPKISKYCWLLCELFLFSLQILCWASVLWIDFMAMAKGKYIWVSHAYEWTFNEEKGKFIVCHFLIWFAKCDSSCLYG